MRRLSASTRFEKSDSAGTASGKIVELYISPLGVLSPLARNFRMCGLKLHPRAVLWTVHDYEPTSEASTRLFDLPQNFFQEVVFSISVCNTVIESK